MDSEYQKPKEFEEADSFKDEISDDIENFMQNSK